MFKDDFKQLTGKLWFSYIEAFLTSLVVGLAENYFSAFALHMGLSALESGVLVSVPLIFAAVLQFLLQTKLKATPLDYFIKRSLFLQSISLVIMSLLALLNYKSFIFFSLLILYSLYWLGHFSIQPAWNRWVADIIPLDHGQKYFSLRSRISQVGIVIGLVFGGALLHLNILNVAVDKLFFILFVSCFTLKILIIQLFKKHPVYSQPLILNADNFKKIYKKNKYFFNRYSVFNITLYFSAPFVAGYLLAVKNLNYMNFMWVMASLFVGKILTTYYLNFNKSQFDPHKLLLWGGIIASPLPALWPFCSTVVMMCLVHLVSGIGWAAWEVGLSLYFFKSIDSKYKIETISLYNYLSIFTQVLGTLLAAYLFRNHLDSNFDVLFIMAGLVRLIAILGLRTPRLANIES
ncbi:MAG: MFS transporter [Pseudobdellovibrio sp.]